MPDIGWYGLVLVIAALATAALTVPAKRIALRVGYVAHPGERTVHKKPIPYGGGAAMFMGFLVAVLGAAAVPQLRQIFTDSPEMTGVVLAAGAMFAVGLIDDVRDMSAPAKMAGQVLAASILYFSGVTMYELKIPLAGFFVLTPGIVPLITAAWVIALTNAVNLIDGLDGLAAGVVAIGGGALAIYGIRLMGLGLLPSDNIGPLVAVIACGICLGFLPFNFNPARIFIGDAGAHFLGLLMAASTMVIGGRVPTAVPISGVTYFFFAPLFIPILILDGGAECGDSGGDCSANGASLATLDSGSTCPCGPTDVVIAWFLLLMGRCIMATTQRRNNNPSMLTGVSTKNFHKFFNYDRVYHFGCCWLRQWIAPSPQISSTQSMPMTLCLGRCRCRISNRLAVVSAVPVGRHQQRAVDEIEVDVSRRQPLAVVFDDARHRDFDDFKRLAVLVAQQFAAARRFSLEHLVVVVFRIVFDGRDDLVGSDESGQIVDVPVGVVAGDSVAEPADVFLAVIILQISLDLRFATVRDCGSCSAGRSVVVRTVPAPLKSTAPPSMTIPG